MHSTSGSAASDGTARTSRDGGATVIYALVLVASMAQSAVVPLLPRYAATYDLSSAQTGTLLAATGVTMLLLAAPAGMAGDRVGARRLTLAGGVLVTVSALGQALADSYPALLGWRIVFGAAFAVVWTAAPAWLAQTAPGGGEARVGAR